MRSGRPAAAAKVTYKSSWDWMPTLLAAAGDPDVVKKVADGYIVGDKTFKQHLDGYNFLPFFQGKAEKSPRHEIYYFGHPAK